MTTSSMNCLIAAAIVHSAFAGMANPSQVAMRDVNQTPDAMRCDELVNRPDGPVDGQCRRDGSASVSTPYRILFKDGEVRDSQ